MTRRLDLLVGAALAVACLPMPDVRCQQPNPPAINSPVGSPAASPAASTVAAERLAEIFAGGEPQTVAELEAMQKHVQDLVQQVLPATVSLPGASGVLVRRDGQSYVLSAAHVTMMADQNIQITKSNGTRLRGTSRGADHQSDVALVRVDSQGDHPAAEIGKSAELKRGQWVLMLGHPSGQKPGCSAPARLGRVLRVPQSGYLVTDCTMQAGDSGGPLFDMQGRVVGINSRINANLAMNMHAPVDALVAQWSELHEGKVTQASRRGARARIGFGVELNYGEGCPVFGAVAADSAAAKAGLQQGDRLLAIDGNEVDTRRSVQRALRNFQADQQVAVMIERNGQGIELHLQLVKGAAR